MSETAASLEASTVGVYLGHDDKAGLEAFCREAGKRATTRLTVIGPDGKVLADSDEDPARMENHNDPP